MAKEETKLVLFLKSIGISGRYKGFYYLKEAVFLSSVARAIRTVCLTASTNETQLRKFFPNYSFHGTLYPKELIELAADYVRYH